jgi:DNA repair protein RecO (recombination protein O)
MTHRSLQAWVLHKYWSGDTSARVIFFSRELGLIQCLCKGGRTPKKQSLLQAFTPLWLNVNERYDQYFAGSIESIAPMLYLEGHALFSGLYVNELLYRILSPSYPDTDLFDTYLSTLNGLAGAPNRLILESILRRFEWMVLKVCGHAFSLTQDARSGEDIVPHAVYQFNPGEGLVITNTGIPGEHILALAENNLDHAEYLKSAKIIMRKALEHVLGGREIKARALYQGSSVTPGPPHENKY